LLAAGFHGNAVLWAGNKNCIVRCVIRFSCHESMFCWFYSHRSFCWLMCHVQHSWYTHTLPLYSADDIVVVLGDWFWGWLANSDDNGVCVFYVRLFSGVLSQFKTVSDHWIVASFTIIQKSLMNNQLTIIVYHEELDHRCISYLLWLGISHFLWRTDKLASFERIVCLTIKCDSLSYLLQIADGCENGQASKAKGA